MDLSTQSPYSFRLLTLAYCGVDIKHTKAMTGMPLQTILFWMKEAREHGCSTFSLEH
jgi:hypothetical protein